MVLGINRSYYCLKFGFGSTSFLGDQLVSAASVSPQHRSPTKLHVGVSWMRRADTTLPIQLK